MLKLRRCTTFGLSERVGPSPTELGLSAELVHVAPSGVRKVGVKHGDVSARLAPVTGILKILVVATLENVDFGIMNLRVYLRVGRTVLGAKVLRAANNYCE